MLNNTQNSLFIMKKLKRHCNLLDILKYLLFNKSYYGEYELDNDGIFYQVFAKLAAAMADSLSGKYFELFNDASKTLVKPEMVEDI